MASFGSKIEISAPPEQVVEPIVRAIRDFETTYGIPFVRRGNLFTATVSDQSNPDGLYIAIVIAVNRNGRGGTAVEVLGQCTYGKDSTPEVDEGLASQVGAYCEFALADLAEQLRNQGIEVV